MKMKLNLKKKTIIGIVLLSIVLASTAMTISYRTYENSIAEHYKQLAVNISATVTHVIDAAYIKTLKDGVMEIYWKDPAPEFSTQTQAMDYLAQYDALKDDQYEALYDLLEKIKLENNVQSLYIGYSDPLTMTSVYFVDPGESEYSCSMGQWDIALPENVENPEHGTAPYITDTEEYGWLCTASAPIITADGEVVGHVLADISMNDIMAEQREYLLFLSLVILCVTVVIILIATFLVNKVLVKPINALALAASSYVKDKGKADKGDISEIAKLQIKTGDEVENLSCSIKQMEQDMGRYIENITFITAEKERISAELGIATQIQASMLPSIFPAFPEQKEFDLFASMTPAKEVGGDFYDFFLVDANHLVAVIADVSGKGVPAALFMVIAKTLLKNAAGLGLSPKEILEKVNNQLCENNEAEMFVTVWLGILDISSGKMICANAGHEYPVIKKANGNFELFKDKHGFVLAGLENTKYHEYEIAMEKGDILYVYTDGVPEATDEKNRLFGVEKMISSLNKSKEKPLEEILHNMKKEIDIFVGNTPQFDDITMLSLKFKGGTQS